MATSDAWQRLERHLSPATTERLSDEHLAGLPTPIRRYFEASLRPGTVLARGARLEMRGRIKLNRWLSFGARQLLVPAHGTVWAATVARVIRGSDRYVDGRGGMVWKLVGVIPLVRADGPDVSRSAAERAAGESMWVPTATLATADTWTAVDDRTLRAHVAVEGHDVDLQREISEDGHLRASWFMRWGDPDGNGTWAQHPFGVEATAHHSFDGVTIPHRGRAGWHFGTDRWADGVFFEFEITRYELAG